MMKQLIRRSWLVGFMVLTAAPLKAQINSAVHVFPQVVDGAFGDGSSYNSFLSVTNLSGGTATCTLTSVGVPADRFIFPLTRTMADGFTALNGTSGERAFTSGYATLNCSRPVQAMLVYSLVAPWGDTLGMATVPPAPKSSYASFAMFTGTEYRYGVAIANPTGVAITINLAVTAQDGQFTGKMITIPAGGRFVAFVDEVLAVPTAFGVGLFEMNSVSQFNVTALIVDGAVFSTLIPAILP